MSYSALFNEVNDLSASTLFGVQPVESQPGQFENIHPQLAGSSSDILFSHQHNRNDHQSDEYYADALRHNSQNEFSNYGPMLSNPTLHHSLSHEFQMSYHDTYETQTMYAQQQYSMSQNDFQHMQYMQQYQLHQLDNTQETTIPKISNSSQETNNASKDNLYLTMNQILPSDGFSFPAEPVPLKRKAALQQQTSTSTLVQGIERDEPEVWALLEAGQDAFFVRCEQIVAELRLANPGKFTLYDASIGRYANLSMDFHSVHESSKPKASKRQRGQPHTPRPSNSFILYRKSKHALIMASYHAAKPLNNNFISKMVAKWWRYEPADVKMFWSRQAEEEKRVHSEKYPDYKYRPKKSVGKSDGCMGNGKRGGSIAGEMESLDSVREDGHYNPMFGHNVQMHGAPIGYYGTPIAPNPHPTSNNNFTNSYSYSL